MDPWAQDGARVLFQLILLGLLGLVAVYVWLPVLRAAEACWYAFLDRLCLVNWEAVGDALVRGARWIERQGARLADWWIRTTLEERGRH